MGEKRRNSLINLDDARGFMLFVRKLTAFWASELRP